MEKFFIFAISSFVRNLSVWALHLHAIPSDFLSNNDKGSISHIEEHSCCVSTSVAEVCLRKSQGQIMP
jgi:hypothetical protein